MPRGGKRKGSGAKLKALSPRISKTIRFSQSEWDTLIKCASILNENPSEYIRHSVMKTVEEWNETKIEIAEGD